MVNKPSDDAKHLVERISSHIPGLDPLMQGGFVKGSTNLISGGAGTGKTIFALQFIYYGLLDNEPALFITCEENIQTLVGDANVMGWDFTKFENNGKCIFLTFKPIGNPDILTKIEKLISENNIKRVVIDSISVFSMVFKDNLYRMRSQFYIISDMLKRLGCTVLLTAEIAHEVPLDVSSGSGALSRDGITEFIADSVITLHNTGIGGESDRALRIIKMRRTNHERSPIPMRITSKGIEVLSQA